jgi:hypothetical protein
MTFMGIAMGPQLIRAADSNLAQILAEDAVRHPADRALPENIVSDASR